MDDNPTQTVNNEPPTKVFTKAGLDIETSSLCYYQQWFGLDVQCSAFVFNFNAIFLTGHLYQDGRSMNFLPSQILELWRSLNRHRKRVTTELSRCRIDK